MSRIPSNVNTKVKRETSKITRTETTSKRVVAKPSTTTTATSLTKKSTAKPSEDKDTKRIPATVTKKPITKTTNDRDSTRTTNPKAPPSKIRTSKPQTQTLGASTTPRAGQTIRKSLDPKQNATQSPRITKISSKAPSNASPTPPRQPLRAKHTSEIKEAVRKNALAKTKSSAAPAAAVQQKPNAVLDTHSNVTVSSPPARRKSDAREVEEKEEEERKRSPALKLQRKGSRVLAPDEIVVLKRESAKKRIEEQIRRESVVQVEQPTAAALKEPVAFEVNFDEREKSAKPRVQTLKPEEVKEPRAQSLKPAEVKEPRERSRSRARQAKENNKAEEESNYSDDFDSYESDFETGSSHKSSQETSSSENSEDNNNETTEEEEEDNDVEDDDDEDQNDSEDEESGHEDESPSELEKPADKQVDDVTDDDESEITQDPITVLQRDKERKLDSGHYEMNSRRNPKLGEMSAQSTQHLVDSFEAFSLNTSDQLDSGISGYGPATLNLHNSGHKRGNFQIFFGGYKDFVSKPIWNKRGHDLMSKIQMDTLEFTLLDLKPISYDVFMQTFGKLNTSQSSTQTQDNLMEVEQQTELWETRSMWTQHPAQYDWDMVQALYKEGSGYKGGVLNQNCCGEFTDEGDKKTQTECGLEQSLQALKELGNQRSVRNLQNHVKIQRKPIDYERLNSFLLKSSVVINQILGSSGNSMQSVMRSSELGSLERITESCYGLQTNFLNTLKVVKIFSNPKHNLVVTVHESLPETDVYRSDFSQLLMVWCINVGDKPLRLLTTWSQVARVEISNDSADIVVAALRDGSVALWDLRETYSFCSKLDGYLTHFAATQSVVPSWAGVRGKTEALMDLGSCLDVRSFRSPSNNWGVTGAAGSHIKTQFVSLHDSGLLTVWTLVESTEATLNPLSSLKTDKQKHSMKLEQKFGYSSPWARVKLIQSSIVYLKDYLETKSLQSLSRFDKTKALFQKNIYSDDALKELHENNGADMGHQGLRFTSIECGSETIYICTNRNFILMCSKTLKPERFRRITLNESRLLFPTALKVLTNEHFLAVGLSNGAVMILNCALNKQIKSSPSSGKCKTPGTPFPGHSGNDSPSSDTDPVTGKSCAIQNIVLNSQKSYDSMDFTAPSADYEFRPDTAAFVALIDTNRKPFELRVYDQQIILAGSVLRRNLIQTLELSSDGWRLFALSNGRIRVYDFYLDQEIGSAEEEADVGKVLDIGCGKINQNESNLIVLEKESTVKVYVLKK